MLRIAKLELRRRKSKDVTLIAVMSITLSALIAVQILNSGVSLDDGIYTINIPIDFKPFRTSSNPDLIVKDGYVILRGDFKSYSAFDEFRKYIRQEYNRWVYENYGDRAFPVLIRLHKIPTEIHIEGHLERVKKGKVTELPQTTPKPVERVIEKTPTLTVSGEKKVERKVISIESPKKQEYLLPENLQPPILFKKFAYAFMLTLPFYFIAQVFTSSFMEDKIKRRFDVLLSVVSENQVLIGRVLPYMTIGLVLSTSIAFIFGGNILVIPLTLSILILMLSIDSFLVFLSRSYKELSFLSMVVTLVVTSYLFIPAVFSFIPMSNLSPVTILVKCLSGEKIDYSYILLSILHLSIISLVLFYLTMRSFEFMYSQSLIGKMIELSTKLTDRYYKVFLFTFLSIPFVLLIELFMLSVTFPLKNYIVILVVLAIVEEFFKGLFIYSASLNGLSPYISATLSALGFFAGEKIILLSFIPTNVAGMLVLPLLAHVTSAFIFALTMRCGFELGVLSASTFHSIYNGLVLWMLLR